MIYVNHIAIRYFRGILLRNKYIIGIYFGSHLYVASCFANCYFDQYDSSNVALYYYVGNSLHQYKIKIMDLFKKEMIDRFISMSRAYREFQHKKQEIEQLLSSMQW